MFSVLSDYIANKPLINKTLIFPDIQKRLKLLSEHFKRYFDKESYEDYHWVLNPFAVEKTKLSGQEEEEIAELSLNRRLLIGFNQKAIASFWLSVANEYLCFPKRQQNFTTFCNYLYV